MDRGRGREPAGNSRRVDRNLVEVKLNSQSRRPTRVKLPSFVVVGVCLISLVMFAAGRDTSANLQQEAPTPPLPQLCAACVRGNLDYLAGPALRGRGSGTIDEYHAAQFIARKLAQYGLAPAAGKGRYIQVATVRSRKVTAAPVLSFHTGESPEHAVTWTHGNEMAVLRVSQPDVSGPLQNLDATDGNTPPADVKEGAVVLLRLKLGTSTQDVGKVVQRYMQSKAAIIVVPEPSDGKSQFEQLSSGMPRAATKSGDDASGPNVVFASTDAANQLWMAPDGTMVKWHAEVTPWKTSHTWNVLAKIEGTAQKEKIILLSAHLDHLGVRHGKTYPGADDDASGTVAVMELARVLAKEPRPKRSLVFALWGSEEVGLVGAKYFLEHPAFDLQDIVANLEFEMIARPDPELQHDQLWLTGWERSDLGPALAQHGAKLTGDPHPDQNFFARSDNYALAKDGIVAQTVSSYGLHKDYHRPTDTLEKVDWQHLDAVIASMIGPVTWLANSDFTPQWKEGMNP